MSHFSLIADNEGPNDHGVSQLYRAARCVHTRSRVRLYTSLKLLSRTRLRQLFGTNVAHCRYGLRATPSCFSSLYSARARRRGVRALRTTHEIKVSMYDKKVVNVNRAVRRHVRFTFALERLRMRSVPVGLLRPVPNAPLRGVSHLTRTRVLAAVTLFHFVGPATFLHFTKKHSRVDIRTMGGTLCVNVGSTVIKSLLAALNSGMSRSGVLVRRTKCSL